MNYIPDILCYNDMYQLGLTLVPIIIGVILYFYVVELSIIHPAAILDV